ncbi:D-inositol 3-phosphate glycosyltransferase [bacterium HR25]|nr:D-inositol 3-phosphate glycosyltransferase [bacterium HR25]
MCRIAVLTYHSSPLALPGTRDSGGMNVYVREVGKELGRRGHCLDIFTRRAAPDSPAVQPLAGNVRLVQIEAGPWEADKEDLYTYLPQFVRGVMAFAEREGRAYDLVHSHYWLSGWAGQLLKERWRLPHVMMFHTLGEVKSLTMGQREPAHRIRAERELARGADRIICPSQDERRMLERLYGVEGERIRVVPCGVDARLFHPADKAAARARLGLPDDLPLVLFVGRLEAIKGLDLLLRAFALLQTPARLLIVGGDERDDERRQRLERLARALSIRERLEFRPAVPHEELPLHYNAADVCAVPSYYESFGLVALEAMACGVPVVASGVGGLRDTVLDGETGYLVPTPQPRSFARRLEALLADAALRQRLGEAARRQVARYDWQRVADGVESTYRELLGHRHPTYVHGGCR